MSDTESRKGKACRNRKMASTPEFGRTVREYRGRVPRAPRDFVPGGIYHVFSRGSNRQALFRFDSDRVDFLTCLGRVVRVHELSCLTYCLMPNHYHLIVQVDGRDLSRAMKALNGRYALRFNRRYGRDAHLFRNRFGAVLQESDEQLLWTLRYAVQNPVQSGLCTAPDEWPWSSYSAALGLQRPPPFLDVDRLLSLFGEPADLARSRYVELVAEAGGV